MHYWSPVCGKMCHPNEALTEDKKKGNSPYLFGEKTFTDFWLVLLHVNVRDADLTILITLVI